MFYGHDEQRKTYMTRAHLAEVIELLGPPPLDLIQRGSRSPEFFTEDGKFGLDDMHQATAILTPVNRLGLWNADVPIAKGPSLEDSEENLEGENKKDFMTFLRGMLQWRPEDRKTAKKLLEDPWLNRY